MSSLNSVFLSLSETPAILEALDIDSLFNFVGICRSLESAIRHSTKIQYLRVGGPPPLLPAYISSFIAERLGLAIETIDALWSALKYSIWEREGSNRQWEDPRVLDELNSSYNLCMGLFCLAVSYPSLLS